jgi:hypothetical protein
VKLAGLTRGSPFVIIGNGRDLQPARWGNQPLPRPPGDWHLLIMQARGDALFPRRYLDEFEKRISELHRCAERARDKAAEAMCQAIDLLLDAADAHEQAAMAYELTGSNGHAGDFQARAARHRQDAAARRAAAAALTARIRDRRDRDDLGLQVADTDSDPLGLLAEPELL